MIETELEKVVKQVFSAGKQKNVCRKFHHFKYETIEGKKLNVAIPWICATNDEFNEFLKDAYFFYQNNGKGIVVEYVVNLLFFVVAKHDKKCEDAVVCCHSSDYVRSFMTKSLFEQEKIVDLMVRDDFYNERLQFFWNKSNGGQHIFSIMSKPDFDFCADGFFNQKKDVVMYSTHRFDGFKTLPEETNAVFIDIEKLFKDNINRENVYDNAEFQGLLMQALHQDYCKKVE